MKQMVESFPVSEVHHPETNSRHIAGSELNKITGQDGSVMPPRAYPISYDFRKMQPQLLGGKGHYRNFEFYA